MINKRKCQVAIVGAGFTGLSAAYELSKRGIDVVVLEAEKEIGGLAAAFDVGQVKLDRFYHHWFTSDQDALELIDELGLTSLLDFSPTNTAMFYDDTLYKLSSPRDLLTFKALGFVDRIRLGAMTLQAKRVRRWRELENKTADEWLTALGGSNVFCIVWEPLLTGKFGSYAKEVSAVWIWNKLKLRGGSRGKAGEERLAYLKGGFIALAKAVSESIRKAHGRIELNSRVTSIEKNGDKWRLDTVKGRFSSDRVIVTTALPLVAEMIADWAPSVYLDELRRIRYIGNVCLVLELDRPLSQTYWLNINDDGFPFVGVIEHTNFQSPSDYGGKHIVYLSKYLNADNSLFVMGDDELLEYSLPFLSEIFPDFKRDYLAAYHVWRAKWSQPIVENKYSLLIPQEETPYKGLYICSMAQIYPEDRGTNYAIQRGRRLGLALAEELESYYKDI